MIGSLGLFSSFAVSPGSPGSVDLIPQFNSVGQFLVCLDLVVPSGDDKIYVINCDIVSTLVDPSTGSIPANVNAFRTRHVQRKVWEPASTQAWYYLLTASAGNTILSWAQVLTSSFAASYRYWSPFAKPVSFASSTTVTGVSPSTLPPSEYLSMAVSHRPEDRYESSGINTSIQPDPIYFNCYLKDGQYLRITASCFVDDPFKINAYVPTLSDTIPTTNEPGASESAIAFPGGLTVWMMRI